MPRKGWARLVCVVLTSVLVSSARAGTVLETSGIEFETEDGFILRADQIAAESIVSGRWVIKAVDGEQATRPPMTIVHLLYKTRPASSRFYD